MKDDDHKELLMTTGQFAALCGVKKDTLFYYDSIGILKPAKVTDNGYRYYSTIELNRFHSITTLQESGLTLNEIRHFLTEEDPHVLVPIFTRMGNALREKQRMYGCLAVQVENTLKSMEMAGKIPFYTPRIENMKAINLAAMKTGQEKESDKTRLKLISSYYKYCTNNLDRADFFRGGIINQSHIMEKIEKGHYLDYLCVRLNADAQLDGDLQSVLIRKPAGSYAVINCHGGIENTLRAIEMLQNYIRDNDFKVCGDGYEFEVIGTFTAESESTCVKQVEIQIEQKSL